MSAPSRLKNKVIRASAGSGKTFQLSNRFLALAAEGAPLDGVLATTFTRKAAAEILGRVLMRLAEAAAGEEKLAELQNQLRDGTLDRPRCLALLAAIVRQLHRLRVGTLDSFFLQIAGSFSLELRLPPGWQIVEVVEDSRLRQEAIRQVLRSHTTGDLLSLMHLLTKGQTPRSVSRQISDLVDGLYATYIESEPAAWDRLPRKKALGDAGLAEAIAALDAAPVPSHKGFQNAHAQAMEAARSGNWQELTRKGLAAKLIEGASIFYNKPIPEPLRRAYEPLIEHAQAVIVNQVANQTQGTCRLLEHFDDAYRRLKRERRAFRFDDVTRLLGDPGKRRRLEEEGYRLDARLSHLLLDEFQDTSPPQWRVLRPLAEHVADGSGGRTFFCVGDVKQAIYGWRGGMAEIFDALERELPRLTCSTLLETRRCGPAVIETVNRVFGRLADNGVLRQDRYREGAARWAERFEPHSTARKDLPGYCRLVAARRADEGEDQQVVTWRFAADEVKRLAEKAPGFTIGVLVRRNVAVARIIYELRRLHVEASEEGGNPLSDSPAVELILSLLTLADHPGHTAARFRVAESPLGAAVGLTDWRDNAAASRLAREIRRSLVDDGYGRVVAGWARSLAPHCDARDQSRLEQLVEMAYDCEPSATLRADDFAAIVRATRVEDPRPSGVRVMTIHQAKGLEFDVVVLPELDVRLIGQSPRVVVHRPNLAQPIDRVLRYVSQEERALLPESFREMFADHDRRAVEETLCLLYVAMTRAIHALHMIVNPAAEKEKSLPATMAGMLRSALTDGQKLDPEIAAFEEDNPEWFRRVEAKALEPAAPAEEPIPAPAVKLAPASKRPLRGLDRRSPSQLEGGTRVSLAQRLRLDAAAAFQRGSILHAWFQQIEWLDEGEPDDRALGDAAAALVNLAELELAALIRQFRRALSTPLVRSVLTRATYRQPAPTDATTPVHAGRGIAAPHWQVWRERPFALREDDVILSGAIDRLVALYDGDRPVGADVIDFKTDVLPAGDAAALEARVEFYRPQLDAYRRAAARLLGLEPGCVGARLVFTDPGVVRTV